ncbi:MAG: hypothetical protein ACSLEZ_14685 [Thiobacillus sp.]
MNDLLAQCAQLLTASAHLTKQAHRAERAGEAVFAMRVEASALRADAAQLATVAQAEALCRIAEVLETMLEASAAENNRDGKEAAIAVELRRLRDVELDAVQTQAENDRLLERIRELETCNE